MIGKTRALMIVLSHVIHVQVIHRPMGTVIIRTVIAIKRTDIQSLF